jgi:hypothetical protein
VKHKLQGHTTLQGIPISIENKKGSVRRGTDDDGHEWRTKLQHHYGYIKRTEGADGEEVDVFIGPNRRAPNAYIISQNHPDGTYDEEKIMLGFDSEKDAKAAYFENYDRRDLIHSILEMPVETLKRQWGFRIPIKVRLKFEKARKPDPRQLSLFGAPPREADVEAHTRQVGGKRVRVKRHKRKTKGRKVAPKEAPTGKMPSHPLEWDSVKRRASRLAGPTGAIVTATGAHEPKWAWDRALNEWREGKIPKRTGKMVPEKKPEEPKPAKTKADPWHGTLDEESREQLFAAMRKLDAENQKLHERHRKLQPPSGTIGVGAADFDVWIQAYSIDEYLMALRAGKTPQEALKHAHDHRRLAIEKHNQKRTDYTWKRAESHGEEFLNRKAKMFEKELEDAKKKEEQKPLSHHQKDFLRRVGKLDDPAFVSPGDVPPGGYWKPSAGAADIAEDLAEEGYLKEMPGGTYGLTPKGYREAEEAAPSPKPKKKRGLTAFQQERQERAEEKARKLHARAESEWESSRKETEHIPMGQPILRGHHSERRHRAALRRSHSKARRSMETRAAAEAAERSADAAGAVISSDDPEAVEALTEKLEGMEKLREQYKKLNAAHRKGGWEAVAKLVGKERAAKIQAGLRFVPGRATKPIQPFQLTNLGANIRRVRERIEGLERKAAEPEQKPMEGKGYRVEEHKDDNRIRIFFDAKPPSGLRSVLKKNGWRWSPKAGAWQRQITENGRASARRMVEVFPEHMSKARLAGDRYAWAVAAVQSGHPRERRTLYAILSGREEIAKAIAPGTWKINDEAVELAGLKLFADSWHSVRQHWGFKRSLAERAFAVFRKALDPVEEFDKATELEALAWAASNLPEPDDRRTAFGALEDAIR